MPARVTCTDTKQGEDFKSITNIGYTYTGERKYERSPAEVHDKIKDGKEFYVKDGSDRIYLQAVKRGDTKYVRTKPDGEYDNNLLSLDSC